MSEAEVMSRLDATESNYELRGEPASLDHLEGILAASKFSVRHDVEFIFEKIKSLSKVDKFFKRHAKQLAKPLSILLYAIQESQEYPRQLKIANLVLLDKRTIFYLDFLAKIFEACVDESLDDLLPPETEGQFAYQKNRSTDLCVAIGLHKVECSTEKCINIDFDCKKAFDSTYWKTVIQTMESKTGSGKFFLSYLSGRSYIFDINRYSDKAYPGFYKGFSEKTMGRGAPPGTILGPRLFSEFQETDTAMNLSNKTWIWPGKFSDDKSPIAIWSNLKKGLVQEGLDGTWEWRGENHIDYHVTGPKRPFWYVFRKDTADVSDHNTVDLRMGDYPIERAYEKVQLGIRMKFFEDTEHGNKYGYSLEWRGKLPLGRTSYRLQDMKFIWKPEFIRTCVQSYVVGKLQYGAALYWLRGSQTSICKARLDYVIAMAACCGLTAPEVVGLIFCSANTKLPEHNLGYQKLCKFLNLPTLKDLAILHARRLVKQWSIFDMGSCIKNGRKILNVVAPSGSLLSDLFQLSCEKTNVWYPEYQANKALRSFERKKLCDDLLPEWQQVWKLAKSETSTVYAERGATASDLDCMNTYWLENRRRFNVLERLVRAQKRH